MNLFANNLIISTTNMTISSLFAKTMDVWQINKICMVSFILVLILRMFKIKQIDIGVRSILYGIIKALYYCVSLYSLVVFSFIISDFVDQLNQFNKIKITKFIIIAIIIVFGMNGNLNEQLELVFVMILERVLKNLIHSQRKEENTISDIIGIIVFLIASLALAIFELINQQLIEEVETELEFHNYAIWFCFMIFLFFISINRMTLSYKLKRYKLQGIIQCILFGVFQLTIQEENQFNTQIVWPALIFLMVLDLIEYQPDTISLQQYDEISLNSFIDHINSHKDARNLLIQLIMNFSFMFVELIYGFISNSLGLISDSLHMLIDSSALAIALYANYVSKKKPSTTFTFGYERVEILSGYVNGIFLLYAVIEIISESFERLMTPQEVLPEKMILVSILGLLVNLMGLYFFHGHAHMPSENSCSHDHNHNLSGVYLHILADALGSVACIVSALLIYYYDFKLSDPITSIIISLLILGTTFNLIKDTSKILLNQLPLFGRKIQFKILEQFKEKQIKYEEFQLWQFKNKKLVCTGKFLDSSQQSDIHEILQLFPQISFQGIDFVD
ncbi:hypothetical protein pb186bvf_008746 [Paramecium bursaria]